MTRDDRVEMGLGFIVRLQWRERRGFVAFNKLVLNTTSAVSRKKPRVVRCSRMKQNSVPRTLIHIVCDLNLHESSTLDSCWEFNVYKNVDIDSI